MKNLGYYNGHYDELSNMKVDYNDRGCFFGDGIYDVAYCYNKRIFALEEHIDRFFDAADYINIDLNIKKEDLKDLIYDLIGKVNEGNLIIYWQATRGSMIRDHSYPDGIKSNLWISIKQGTLRDIYRPVKVIFYDDIRHQLCNIKSLNLLPNVIAIHEAEKRGACEVIFHREGRVTECAHSNVSILKRGELITPPADNLILAGTCRKHLINIAKSLDIKVKEKKIYMEDILGADEIILTAAGSLAIEVSKVGIYDVGGKDRDRLYYLRKGLVEEFNNYTGADLEVLL